VTLDELIAVFRKYLYLPDPGPLLVVLGAVAANLLAGDPVWLLLVGPPSSGKTEILSALSQFPYVHEVSTFTEAGLLSGSASRKEGATGGLLAEIGKFGIIVFKEVTSILSESREVLSGLIAALREIYDGRWSRVLGTAGGRRFGWTGKVGLVGAVTETIERHTAVIGSMGERFVLYRMPELDEQGRLQQGRASSANTGRREVMRAELSQAASAFLGTLTRDLMPPEITAEEAEALVLLADLAARCRSVVERDARDRQVELVPQPELPARLQTVLTQLTRGLRLVGVPNEEIGRLLLQVALDGISKTRRALVELLVTESLGRRHTVHSAAARIRMPVGITGRTLDELAAHGIVSCHRDDQGDLWEASGWLRDRWDGLAIGTSSPATGA
jgi:hypothetical protein